MAFSARVSAQKEIQRITARSRFLATLFARPIPLVNLAQVNAHKEK